MSAFLYFFSSLKAPPTDDVLAKMGVLDRFKGSRPSRGVPEPGPNGLQGMMVTCSDGDMPSYDAAAQEWRECAGGKYWLGFVKGSPPGPSDLLRAPFTSGELLMPLGDGNLWGITCQAALPSYWDVDAGGEAFNQVCPECRALSDEADRVYRAQKAVEAVMKAPDDMPEAESAALLKALEDACLSPEEELAIAVEALAQSYRGGVYEIAALRLLSKELAHCVNLALIDHPSVQPAGGEAKKKGKS